MERMTEWNDEQTCHAYYPRCFEEPCYGSGCKIKACPFETAVCERLEAYEDIGLTPEEIKAPFTEDTRTAVCSWECERREVDAGLLLDMQKPGIQKELRLPVSVLEAQVRTVLGEGIGTEVLFRRGMQRL